MKTFKVYSSKNQGSYKKDELITNLTESQFLTIFGDLDYQSIRYFGDNHIYIKK